MTSIPKTPIDPITFTRGEEHPKGWGKEIWIVNNDKYCGKILEFDKGAEFSMHYHMLKHETFYILEGKIELRGYDLTDATPVSEFYSEGMVITIPAGNPHKIIAVSPTRILEISTPHYESDSYRVLPGNSQKK